MWPSTWLPAGPSTAEFNCWSMSPGCLLVRLANTLVPDGKEVSMAKLRVNCFSISIDGYGAGPNQSLENPLGVGGESLHEWIVATQTFQQMSGNEGGTTGEDDEFVARGFDNIGAWILGRNMFGPVRGLWPDNSWKGWWGDTPPYHTPVF